MSMNTIPQVPQSSIAEQYLTRTTILSQGKYSEADQLCHKSLAIQEKALGLEHPHIARPLNNLAELSRAQVKSRIPSFGKIHFRAIGISVVPDCRGMTVPYATDYVFPQGDYEKAGTLHARALAIREKALGLEHPDVAQSLNNLAELSRVQVTVKHKY